MKIHLDKLLDAMKQNMLQMANMVNEAVVYATNALFEKDAKLARTVIERDKQIDLLENKLDQEALKIFALQQPLAIDLRFVVMALKMNNDFERIGDLAVNISERVLDFIDNDYYGMFEEMEYYKDLKYMSGKAREMSQLALEALIEKDPEKGRKVIKMDNVVDSYNKSIIIKSISEISDKPDKAQFYVNLISISKHLERIADHATNVCQDLIYMVEGVQVKHELEMKEAAQEKNNN